MLELKKITKVYKTSGFTQKALKGVSLSFRENEFASILGPSGSGKTTLLNIIGGLDEYTSGDLIISGVSTKRFKDKDWDSYRNHRIGFVFQSYHLIPHQTILRNVSLALTLSGVGKKEARSRAKKALTEVGLGDHLEKRPAQLSGGQMQRVAIARALVNDPDILLADEPTGALDSETSVQIMDLLKRISEKKLVIMVTHNPDLAREYSTRIINLKDGRIISDTNPFDIKTEKAPALSESDLEETEEIISKTTQKSHHTNMSLFTSFGLSLNNLLTKKTRTILISIAGSIGIIGIALILAVSNGFQRYIDSIEEDTMTSYPLTFTSEASDIASLLLSVAGNGTESDTESDLTENPVVANMFGSLRENDLASFKSYLEEHYGEVESDLSNISYQYNIDPLIYSRDVENSKKILKLNPSNVFSSMMGSSPLMNTYSSYSSVYSQIKNTDPTTISNNYEMLAGRWPENYDELVIVLGSKNSIPDLLLYALGLRDPAELESMIKDVMAGKPSKVTHAPISLSYEDLLGLDLRLVQPTSLYRYNSEYGIYEDMSEDEDFMSHVFDSATPLHIVGVATVGGDSTLGLASTGVLYTPELIAHISDISKDTNIVKDQLKSPDLDVFSGKPFSEKSSSLGLDFADFVSVDEDALAAAFGGTITKDEISATTIEYLSKINSAIDIDSSAAEKAFASTFNTLIDDLFASIDGQTIKQSEIEDIVTDYLYTFAPSQALLELESEFSMPISALRQVYSGLLSSALIGYVSAYDFIVPDFITDLWPKDDIPDISEETHEEFPEESPEEPDTPEEPEEDESEPTATIKAYMSKIYIYIYRNLPFVTGVFRQIGQSMTEARVKKDVLSYVGNLVTEVSTSIASSFNVDPAKITSAFRLAVSEEQITRIVTAMMKGDNATADSNLALLGYQDLNSPSVIYFYFNDFDSKDHFMSWMKAYNDSVPEKKQIKYSDPTGFLLGNVKVIIDAITYVLIAFVSISLVVSSIMIGVITYISVYERTKEIGILRAIGASKRNISTIFNSETFMIGLLSGIIAMLFTAIAIPIINTILYNLTEVENLSAYLSLPNTFILILVAIVVTLIGGLIPARSASKKDPVEALRTE